MPLQLHAKRFKSLGRLTKRIGQEKQGEESVTGENLADSEGEGGRELTDDRSHCHTIDREAQCSLGVIVIQKRRVGVFRKLRRPAPSVGVGLEGGEGGREETDEDG